MIDRRALIAGTGVMLVAPANLALASDSLPSRPRELVRASSLVVTGVMRPPEPRPTARDPSDYAEIPVYAVVALKGEAPEPLVFRHTLIEPGIFNTVMPWILAGQPSILFLREKPDAAGPSLWLTEWTSACKATPELLDAVKREIAAQARRR